MKVEELLQIIQEGIDNGEIDKDSPVVYADGRGEPEEITSAYSENTELVIGF